MKKNFAKPLSLFLASVIIFISCSRDTDSDLVNPGASTGPTQNQPPKAVAGADFSIALPYCGAVGSTFLNGNASSDPNNDAFTCLWTKISGSEVKLVVVDKTITKVEGLSAGTYTFELAVTDARGLSSKDTVALTVVAAVPQPFDIDLTTTNPYLFFDNLVYCPADCYVGDLFESDGKVSFSPTEVFDLSITNDSDTASKAYASYSEVSFSSRYKSASARCSVNFKKLLQDGGGPFTGTLTFSSGTVDMCQPDFYKTLAPLTISGTLDVATKQLTLILKGRVYF